MSPIYQYKNPKTGKIFEDIRPLKQADKPFYAHDGTKCKRVEVIQNSNIKGWMKGREAFEADPGYVKKMNPKYIKFNDGHRERYDSTKHC